VRVCLNETEDVPVDQRSPTLPRLRRGVVLAGHDPVTGGGLRAVAEPDGRGIFPDVPPFPTHIPEITRAGSDQRWLDQERAAELRQEVANPSILSG
jgi:hypothetical protein